MTMPADRGSRGRGTILLADISGYTNFLNGVAEAHRSIIIEADEPPAAYVAVSSLLEAALTAIEPHFRLAKFEGDAVFAVSDGREPTGQSVLDCVRACYGAFHTKLAHAESEWSCTCNSCIRLRALDIKFVLHHGDYVVHRIARQEELAGVNVIIAHRLLKNHARDLVGDRPYALISDATIEALDVPTEGMLAGEETYEGLPDVPVHVLPLD